MESEKNETESLKAKILAHIEDEKVRQRVYQELYTLPFCMEQEEFEEILKSLLKYNDGVSVIKNKWRTIINNSENPVAILELYRNHKEIAEDVVSDVHYLLRYSNIDDNGILASEISKFEGGKEAIANEFEEFIKFSHTNLDLIFSCGLSNDSGRDSIKRNFEIFKNKPKEFFKFVKLLEHEKDFEEEYNKYKFWADLYSKIQIPEKEETSYYEDLQKPRETIEELNNRLRIEAENDRARYYKDTIFINLLNSNDLEEKELILKTVANGNEFSYKAIGYDSITFETGNQIVKLGISKNKFEIPYHPRLMMPYFRKKYENNSILEVYNLGNSKTADITDKELLDIYKELENAGIKWGDAKRENLVYLLEDNNVPDFIKSADFNIFGFLEDERFPTNNHKALKKGDLVICDLHFLYTDDDPNFVIGDIDPVIEEYLIKKDLKEKENLDR